MAAETRSEKDMNYIEIKNERETSGIVRDILRRIKVNTEFSGKGQKSICITSSSAEEGKSTISYGLAVAFAEDQGKNILLIDADIRKSHIAERLGYSKKLKGLTECITEQASVTDVIYKTNIENLYITPSGRLTENSTQLFKRESFGNFLKEVRKAFDMIIIDTPPIGYIVDAAVIASLADASIMVVGANIVSKKIIKKSINDLKNANENFLGAVFNKARDEKGANNKRYYQYYRENS